MQFKNLISSISEMMDSLVNKKPFTSRDEINRISNSLSIYANQKGTKFNSSISYSTGDICRIELRANIAPEMSYQHMCVIIGKTNFLYYVLPITTLNVSNVFHSNAYHSIDNPSGNKKLYFI